LATRRKDRDVVQVEFSDEAGVVREEIVAADVILARMAQDSKFRPKFMTAWLEK
jgi:hypothetical protein